MTRVIWTVLFVALLAAALVAGGLGLVLLGTRVFDSPGDAFAVSFAAVAAALLCASLTYRLTKPRHGRRARW